MNAVQDIAVRLEALLEADRERDARALLVEHHPLAEREPSFVKLWLQAMTARPHWLSSVDQVEQVVGTWGGDPEVVIGACAALNALAELRPHDEPAALMGAAHRAATLAEEALRTALPRDQAAYLWINRANALRRCGVMRDDEAVEAYERALEIAPDKGWWWSDLGVCHKWRGRWEAGYTCQLKARARVGEARGILWNMAICATGMGDGDLAAGAWRDLGLPVEVASEEGLPIVEGLPDVELRVASRGPGYGGGTSLPDDAVGFELLSVAPLSPCHGVVQSASFRETPVDYGDVVLWDGDPVTVRERAQGTPVPVFPILACLLPGEERRLRFVAREREEGALSRMADQLPNGVLLQVHQSPHVAEGARASHAELYYGKIVVESGVDLGVVEGAIKERRDGVTLAVPGLYELLGDTRRAGQEHQAWGGMERRWGERRD